MLAFFSAAALLLVPTAAMGDPGRPGLDSAATAVYGQSGQGGNTVDQLTPPGDQGGNEQGGPGADDRGGVGDETVSSPEEGGGVEEVSVTPGSDEGGGSSLPFTGFTAALVLGLGLSALLLGFALRTVVRRPDRA